MPTYTFTRTLTQFRDMVLRKLRVLDPRQTATGVQTELVDEALNLRLKEMHALGTLWFNVSGATSDVALVAGTATASLAAITDLLFPISANLRVGSDDKPIDIITHRQYQALPNKADRGEPEKVFVSAGVAYFWPTPGANYTVKLTYQAIAADAEDGAAPDVSTGMLKALATLVAADLIDDFAVPEARAQRLLAQAVQAERVVLMLNSPRVDATPVEFEAY